MPKISDQKLQELSSGIYNASSTAQWLKTKIVDLELTIGRQAIELSQIESLVRHLEKAMQDHDLI